jgi:hypothetical protein
MRTKDTILLEEAYASIFNEAAKKGKPDWLLAAQLKAEGKKGNGNTKCPKCGCNPDKPKAGCKCKHKNKKMMKEEFGEQEERDPIKRKVSDILKKVWHQEISYEEATEMINNLYDESLVGPLLDGPTEDDMH